MALQEPLRAATRRTSRGRPAERAVRTRGSGGGKPPSALKQHALQIGHWALLILGPVALLSAIAALVLYVRLSHGPVSLKAFAENIEASINAELSDFKAKIDDAVLTMSNDHRLELRLTNLRFVEPDGQVVASAPLAAVELSRSALRRFTVAPERVFLIEPKVSLYYTDDNGLILSFENQTSPGPETGLGEQNGASPVAPAEGTTAVAKGTVTPAEPALPLAFQRVNLARALAEISRKARRGEAVSSKLKEIGVRDATLLIHAGENTSELLVESAAVSLEHRQRRSIILGSATVRSPEGPWRMSFRSEDSERGNFIKVSASVRDLVPSALAKASPNLSLLEPLKTPLTGELALELSSEADLKSASLVLDLARGEINLPALASAPLILDSGQINLAYDAQAQEVKVAPSRFQWGDSQVALVGSVTSKAGAEGHREWLLSLAATEGMLAAEEFGVGAIRLDGLDVQGRLVPDEGLVQLTKLSLSAGGAEISATADIVTGSDGMPSTRVEASMTPTSLETLKALWPRAVVPGARQWVGNHVTRGSLGAATLRLLSGRFLPGAATGDRGRGERLSLSVEAKDLEMVPLPQGLPIAAPKALIRLENDAFEVTVPDAAILAGPKQVPLKDGRFTIVNLDGSTPTGELAFRSQTTLSSLLEAVNRSRLELAATGPLPVEGIDGKVEGQFKITMPLDETSNAPAPKAEGKARIFDIRGKHKAAKLDVQGGAIDVDVSATGVLATGELILNGVIAKINLQRIFDAPPELQPPLRITTTVDNADRTQLGLDVNHLVQGEMAFDIAIAQGAADQPGVHVRADLTNAELMFDDLAWRKVPGQAASLEFDVGSTNGGMTELRNFRIVSDNVAIEGTLMIDGDREVSEFNFPTFSLNVVSRLEVSGKIGSDRVWKIKAKGSTYDGKDLFRSLLALGKATEVEIQPLRPSAGVDLAADIDTVLGHSDVSLRGFKLKLSERKDQLVALDVNGTLDGGKPLSVTMKPDSGRKLSAESLDAGQAFRLIGFYPNLQGGRLRLEVDLAGRGAAEKAGVLWVDDFRVLGDPVLQDIYSSAESSGPAIDGTPQGQRRVVREVFEFSRMKVPFSVGHGQFVLDESYVRGPLVGASIRGKVDYTAQRISLGGTYVPLQGINSAFCEIPLFGPLVSGLDCQGVFGITYAIQGAMAAPQVIVNPLSMFTPGILRGIMEMTNPNPQVQPRVEKPKAPADQRVRASSSTVRAGEAPVKEPIPAAPIDGWSSETVQVPKPVPAKRKPAPKPGTDTP